MTVDLRHGNCLDILPTLPDCSVDSIVTDPPYELGFMGKKWDNSGIAYNVTLWQECLRVLKPGGHLLAFGGTRTYHRMACAIEDAGFEIRDSIHWLYGSGFPKSLDVSKAVDKMNGRRFEDRYALGRHIRERRNTAGFSRADVNAWLGASTKCEHYESDSPGFARVPTMVDWIILRDRLGLSDEWTELVARIEAEREIIGNDTKARSTTGKSALPTVGGETVYETWDITAPATEQAKQWAGWGTALKPAHEPIVVARKPLVGTVASNVLEFGTGAINIDASRIEGYWKPVPPSAKGGKSGGIMGKPVPGKGGEAHQLGRWPANVILGHTDTCDDECVPGCPVALLDEQSEGVSRFFYCAKPSRRERNAGLDHLEEQQGGGMSGSADKTLKTGSGKERDARYQNHHPTVKPLALMRYLVRLVTPPNGTVLEPFAGSGTTLMACVLENFNAIGIEMTDEYLPIIQGRIAWAEQQANEQSPQQELEL